MGAIHFFTEPDKVYQNDIYKFGPIDTGKFRTTSVFSLESGVSSAKVFSAFKGYIYIVDQIFSDGTINPFNINLVLIPVVQNLVDLKPAVKYIIYRGLKRSDFMSLNSSSPSGYDLLSKEQVDQNGIELMKKVYDGSVQNPDLSLFSFEMYNSSKANEAIFNLIKDSRFVVNKGVEIGTFDDLLGIDVVLDEPLKFIPTLNYASIIDKYDIKVDGHPQFNSNSDPGEEHPEILLNREQIHSFIDPAAYLNLYRELGVDYYDGSGKKKTVTYRNDELHEIIISKFNTQERIYIDIRNNNDFSLNFYKDNKNSNYNNEQYLNNLYLKLNEEDLTSYSYYTSNWPILILDNKQSVNGNNYISLFFSFYTHYNPEPFLYFDLAYLWDTSDKSSLSKVSEFNYPKGSDKFNIIPNYLIDQDQLLTYAGIRNVIVPTVENRSSCTLIRLYYLKNTPPDNANLPNLVAPIPDRYVPFKNPFDNIFGNFTSTSIGPRNFSKDSATNIAGSVWRSSLGKRFMPSGQGNLHPRMVQTGFGISGRDVTFFAIDIDQNNLSADLTFGYDTNANVKIFTSGESNYGEFKQAWKNTYDNKFNATKVNEEDKIELLYLDQGYTPSKDNFPEQDFFFSLNLTRLEFLYLQHILAAENNTFSVNNHPIYIGFDLNSKEESDGTLGFGKIYYGKGRMIMQGLNDNGTHIVENALAYPFTDPEITDPSQFTLPGENMFVYTADSKTFCSFRTATQTGVDKNIKQRDPNRGVYSMSEFIEMLEEVERVYDEPVKDTITRLRKYYYGYFDVNTRNSINPKNDLVGTVLQNFLENAIPDAPAVFLGLIGVSEEIAIKLKSQADENGIEDNPSPYIIEPKTNKKIDLGHLLYGLDGLIHNYESTGIYFQRFGLKYSNDFTGYVADIFIASGEGRVYTNNHKDKLEGFYYPDSYDLDRLYDISAPIPDLLSDVDPFGLYNAYTYFQFDQSENDHLPPGGKKKLSWLFKYFYDQNYDPLNTVLYPIDANYKKRWLNFCKGYYSKINPTELIYQGFIEQVNGTWEWKADNINHASVLKLRERGEKFSHFWYQKSMGNYGTTLYATTGALYSAIKTSQFSSEFVIINNLETGNDSIKNPNGVRFERVGSLNPDIVSRSELNTFIGEQTSTEELDYVLNKFLNYVKTQYNNEN
jgi:hypothetical protein